MCKSCVTNLWTATLTLFDNAKSRQSLVYNANNLKIAVSYTAKLKLLKWLGQRIWLVQYQRVLSACSWHVQVICMTLGSANALQKYHFTVHS